MRGERNAMTLISPRKAGKAPARATAPAQAADGDSARQRLLDAGMNLFCRYGINATGVDAIVAEAGTAKTTLYKIFGSKEGLIEAVLETEGQRWRDWFIAGIEAGDGPARERLRRIFPVLKTWFGDGRFYGCPFINAVGEHDKADDRMRTIAIRHKKIVLGHIEKLAAEAGAGDAVALAHQIGLLIDGAIVAAMVTQDSSVADAAEIAAGALLDTFAPSAAQAARKKPRRLAPGPASLAAE
ncbi:transcriptional regulator, TetR family [Enhydrobacter aerosaccus]|uniref:Transcriptional regulator, TetR family n=2 Tax=Enhydrobacter aerosaccus TaxID=225324 RepID=A0A1T4TKA5_9HYPH|nr:transcriptional regulator, TetR family [Enhydrobacter aerosaccus]